MILTAWLLAALAIALAWPVPVFLARATWPQRSPFTALVLWQSIALAGGLSMIGAMLCYGLDPLGENLLAGLREAWQVVIGEGDVSQLGFWHIVALCTAALLGLHLVFTLLLTYARIANSRRRHRELLRLLSSPTAEPGTVLIPHGALVAYCLPGGSRSVTVLSDALVETLSAEELKAVLAHEDTHLTQRHHLLLWAFAAWRAALPWLPTTRLAQTAVNSLLEMTADDAALRNNDRETLVRAIAIVADGRAAGTSTGSLAYMDAEQDSSQVTLARVRRLLGEEKGFPDWARALVLITAAAILLAPTILLLTPAFR